MYLRDKLFDVSPPNVPMTQDRQDLWDAAQLIRKHGHCKHVLIDADGRMCWRGALRKVTLGEAASLSSYALEAQPRRLRNAIERWCIGTGRRDWNANDAARWNNHPRTTPEMVIESMERAALS